jgi:leader peptidase (prepilin peptidase)/N-methyltransferase
VPGAYALYELALGVGFAATYAKYSISLSLGLLLLSLCILAFITIYDLRHTIVPLTASAFLVLSSGLFSYVTYAQSGEFLITLFYAAGIALFFFLLYALSRGRAMGLGDTPVSFALALIAGRLAIAGFLFSFWIGGVIGIGILAFRRGGPRMGIEVPFVPFMALGFLLALFTQWNPLPF